MNDITALFNEKSVFCPEYVAIEAMKMSKYSIILKDEIQECVFTARCQTLCEMIKIDPLREI